MSGYNFAHNELLDLFKQKLKNDMKRIIIIFFTALLFSVALMAQTVGLKTNLAHWAVAATPNLDVEFALNHKLTLEVGGAYNAFDFKDYKKFRHWLIQPEFRYWTDETFNGHFFGLHGLASEFNVGGFNWGFGRLKDIKDHRYEGYTFGAGVSYGYQLPLAKHFSLEFNLGVGYAHLNYDKYKCVRCGEVTEPDVKENYFGVTKAALSLIYLF